MNNVFVSSFNHDFDRASHHLDDEMMGPFKRPRERRLGKNRRHAVADPDEAEHAALSWEVDAWALARLTPRAQLRVRRRNPAGVHRGVRGGGTGRRGGL